MARSTGRTFSGSRNSFLCCDPSCISPIWSCKLSPYCKGLLKSVVREIRTLVLWEPEVGDYLRPPGGREQSRSLLRSTATVEQELRGRCLNRSGDWLQFSVSMPLSAFGPSRSRLGSFVSLLARTARLQICRPVQRPDGATYRPAQDHEEHHCL